MPTTTSLSRYLSCSAASAGISARHGPHHVAQKLTITTLPRQSDEASGRPSMSCSVKAGTGAGLRKKRSVVSLPGGVSLARTSAARPQPAPAVAVISHASTKTRKTQDVPSSCLCVLVVNTTFLLRAGTRRPDRALRLRHGPDALEHELLDALPLVCLGRVE